MRVREWWISAWIVLFERNKRTIVFLHFCLSKAEPPKHRTCVIRCKSQTFCYFKQVGVFFLLATWLSSVPIRSYSALSVLEFLEKRNVQTVYHSLYSPHIATCGFWLFLEVKKELRGHHFGSNFEVIKTAEALQTAFQNWLRFCIQKWIIRWHKCIPTRRGLLRKGARIRSWIKPLLVVLPIFSHYFLNHSRIITFCYLILWQFL